MFPYIFLKGILWVFFLLIIILWIFFQAFVEQREKLSVLLSKHRTVWEVCDIISFRKLATQDIGYSRRNIPELEIDPRAEEHGQEFPWTLFILWFPNKGGKLGNLQILGAKMPEYTHWKTNTQEFLLSIALASVSMWHMCSVEEKDRVWVTGCGGQQKAPRRTFTWE